MVISVDMCYKNFKDWEKALNFSTILYSPVDSLDDMKIKFGYKLLQLKNGNFKLAKDSNLKSLLKKNKYQKIIIYLKRQFLKQNQNLKMNLRMMHH